VNKRISFNLLGELLEQKGKKWFYLREKGISPGIVKKLRYGGGDIDTRTILKLCDLLDCQPGDIMRCVIDDSKITETTRDTE
jgi:DNA-binding Xre family transcriptional regulator